MSAKCRYKKVRQAHLCFICLKPGHGVKECLSKISCKNCGRKHHTMIHPEYEYFPAHSAGHQRGSPVRGTMPTTTGSVASLGDTASAPSQPGMVASGEQAQRLVYSSIGHAAYQHMAFPVDLPVPDLSSINLVIGLDNTECLMPSNIIRGPSSQPFAVQTILGWSLHGPMSNPKCQAGAATFYPKCQADAATFYPKCQAGAATFYPKCQVGAATFYPKCQAGAATFFVQADSGSENPQVEPLSLREQCDERHLQQADKQVLNMWQEATTLEQGHSCMATPFQADKPQQLYCLPLVTPLRQCLGRMFEEEDPSTGIEAKRGPESANGLTPDAKPSVQWNMAHDHSNKSLHYTVGQLVCEKGR